MIKRHLWPMKLYYWPCEFPGGLLLPFLLHSGFTQPGPPVSFSLLWVHADPYQPSTACACDQTSPLPPHPASDWGHVQCRRGWSSEPYLGKVLLTPAVWPLASHHQDPRALVSSSVKWDYSKDWVLNWVPTLIKSLIISCTQPTIKHWTAPVPYILRYWMCLLLLSASILSFVSSSKPFQWPIPAGFGVPPSLTFSVLLPGLPGAMW